MWKMSCRQQSSLGPPDFGIWVDETLSSALCKFPLQAPPWKRRHLLTTDQPGASESSSIGNCDLPSDSAWQIPWQIPVAGTWWRSRSSTACDFRSLLLLQLKSTASLCCCCVGSIPASGTWRRSRRSTASAFRTTASARARCWQRRRSSARLTATAMATGAGAARTTTSASAPHGR